MRDPAPEGRERQDLLDQVLEAAALAVAVLRAPDFTFELASRALVELADGRALVGRTLLEVSPRTAGRLQPLLVQVAERGEPIELPEVELPPPGSPGPPRPARTFALRIQRLREAGRSPPAVLLTALDVTAQVRARQEVERALATEQASRERLALGQGLTAALASARTVQEVADAVFRNGLAAFGAQAGWIVLPDGPDHLVAAAAFGYAEERLRPWQRFEVGANVPIAEAYRERRAVFVSSPAELEARYPALAAASQGRTACLAALPLVVDGVALGALGLTFATPRVFDEDDRRQVGWLTQKCAQAMERARSHEAERAARELAVEIGRLQERFVAVVGHDLRTPLTAITTTAEGLLRRGGLDERQAVGVERMAKSAARMGSIIRDLLDVSVARHGAGILIRREATDLAEVARRAVEEAEAAGVAAPLALRTAGDAQLVGDPTRLAQVAANLVGNAVQHGAGSQVSVEVEGAGPEVILRVHNGGPAIAPALLPHLFEPFRRGGSHPPSPDGGASSIGLGLFIVREVVQSHGGVVTVRSTDGDGTTFEVRLPRGSVDGGAGATPFRQR